MRSLLLNQLELRIRQIEAGEKPLAPDSISLDIPGLADVFPNRSLPAGSLVELLSTVEGAGGWTLALLLARQAYKERRVLVIADGHKRFYPPAASRLGVDLRRTLLIGSSHAAGALAALLHSLRCPAVGAAIGSFERLTSAECRSLQLAAEQGGGVGFLLRPASALRAPSFAALRFLLRPLGGGRARRRIQVEVLRNRGGKPGQVFVLEVDDETGHVLVPAALAAPAPVETSA